VFSRRLEGSKGRAVFGSPGEYVAILINQSTKVAWLCALGRANGRSRPSPGGQVAMPHVLNRGCRPSLENPRESPQSWDMRGSGYADRHTQWLATRALPW
jgi:hypothetical protein